MSVTDSILMFDNLIYSTSHSMVHCLRSILSHFCHIDWSRSSCTMSLCWVSSK